MDYIWLGPAVKQCDIYVFKKQTPEGKSQLQWVRNNILKNQDTRQAVININGIEHKRVTKDFPCTYYRMGN